MYWRFFMSAKGTGTDAGWKWELCRENHAACRAATREFGTLTECMRDAAEHGYHGWSTDASASDAALHEERMAMASVFMPSASSGGQRLH